MRHLLGFSIEPSDHVGEEIDVIGSDQGYWCLAKEGSEPRDALSHHRMIVRLSTTARLLPARFTSVASGERFFPPHGSLLSDLRAAFLMFSESVELTIRVDKAAKARSYSKDARHYLRHLRDVMRAEDTACDVLERIADHYAHGTEVQYTSLSQSRKCLVIGLHKEKYHACYQYVEDQLKGCEHVTSLAGPWPPYGAVDLLGMVRTSEVMVDA